MSARVFLVGWDQRILSSKISVSVYVLELIIKGTPMVFLFHPIVELVDDLVIIDKLLPSKPKTKNMYLWPILSVVALVKFYFISCYFAGVSDVTSFLMRLPIALMYHRDYQQLIIFAFFVDQISARFDIGKH
ncbi:unnamed protein product [Nezara viridula]|uniref:Uncharacterized protein n=1 Tax=Nezara viridula TaxID=85310 RepID=A0A9P0HNN2_NEZVI|nr:unnamed protein product [Nezara viridula]